MTAPLIVAVSAVVGLICGSFVTALSYRLPRGENFVNGRSKCPSCGVVLGAFDLVPVFSWVASKGRCRRCSARVSARYPATELICAVLFGAAALANPAEDIVRLGIVCLSVIVLLSLAVIDLEHRRLPNSLVVLVLVLALGLAILDGRPASSIAFGTITLTAAGLILRFVGLVALARPGLGWGDIKLAAAVGAGVEMQLWPLFLGTFALGLCASVLVYARKRRISIAAEIPFGPALCAAAFVIFV